MFFYQYLWVTKLCVKVGRSRIPRMAVAPKYFIVLWFVWMEPAPFRATKNIFVMCESDRQFRHKVIPTSVNRILASEHKTECSNTIWYDIIERIVPFLPLVCQNCPFFSCHRNKIKCSRENPLVTLWLKQFIVVRIYQTNNRGKDPSISKILSSIHQSVYPALVKPLHGKSFSIIGKMQWKERLLLRPHFISITNSQWPKLRLLSWRTNCNQPTPLYLWW